MNRVVIIHENTETKNQLEMKINSFSNYMCTAIFEKPVSILTENIFCDYIFSTIALDDLSILEKITKKLPNVHIILLTEKLQTNIIFKALQIGVVGLVDRINYDLDLNDVFNAIERDGAYLSPKIARTIIGFFQSGQQGSINFTNRESDIVAGILDGLPYKLIADKHEISINTVRMNIKNIYKKLNINSKSELFIKMGYTNYID
jgi:DNA-binding NarL/FixJ family response regulator